MNKSTLITIVLVVLVLISVVQAFQLNGLKEKISSGQIKTSSSATAVASKGGSTGGGKLPSSLDNLPQMVGGC